jgi:hypothetical protein
MLTVLAQSRKAVQAGTPMAVKGDDALSSTWGQGIAPFFFSEISSGVRGQTAPGLDQGAAA